MSNRPGLPFLRCSYCELHIGSGPATILISLVFKENDWKQECMDVFHTVCWERMENRDATKASDDAPPNPEEPPRPH